MTDEKDEAVVDALVASRMGAKTSYPYAGPDGIKRIEMLEELATAILSWKDRPRWAGEWPRLNRITNAIVRDNERVSRLKNKT